MILQISTDSREIGNRRDPHSSQFVPIPNARLHQNFRCLDGTHRQNKIERSADLPGHAVDDDLNARRMCALEQNAGDQCIR